MLRYIACVLLASTVHGIELTPETWDDATAGKSVFVKFFAPWCGHCKKMKPDWDKLMAEFEDSSTVLVADVDCIEAGKPLCDEVGVKGFPTIKYGSPLDLQDYKLGRDFATLQHFASELKPVCQVDTLEHCSETEKKIVEGLRGKTKKELQSIVDDEQKERDTEVQAFEAELQKLQEKYTMMKQAHDEKLLKLKLSYNIGVVKAMLSGKAKEEL